MSRFEAARGPKRALTRALRCGHPELGRHCDDVASLATAIARRFAFGTEELDAVAQAAHLHDIGKLAIDDRILDKPGPLTDEEWSVMRKHTEIGAAIVAEIPELQRSARLVRHSHERFDGGGYPDGLRREEIPLASRIIFAADAFDAMTSRRPYNVPMSVPAALAELRRCAGSQFDPLVVEILCTVIEGDLSCGFGLSAHRIPAGVTSPARAAGLPRLAPDAETSRPGRAAAVSHYS